MGALQQVSFYLSLLKFFSSLGLFNFKLSIFTIKFPSSNLLKHLFSIRERTFLDILIFFYIFYFGTLKDCLNSFLIFYLKVCFKCGLSIKGNVVKFENMPFHLECFICEQCRTPLSGK